jgi:2'-5' RNA ligase
MHRLFLAFSLPEPIRDLLLDLMSGPEPLRWQSDEQLHCTLRFIGEVERPIAEDLAAALGHFRFEPFELQLCGVGCFNHRRSGALWAGLAPRGPIAALAARLERLCQQIGFPPERRAYHPHITLARWSRSKPQLQPWIEQHAALTSDPWPVTCVTLFESRLTSSGAHYSEVGRFPQTR